MATKKLERARARHSSTPKDAARMQACIGMRLRKFQANALKLRFRNALTPSSSFHLHIYRHCHIICMTPNNPIPLICTGNYSDASHVGCVEPI